MIKNQRTAPVFAPLFEHDHLPHPDPLAQPVEHLIDVAEIQAMGEQLSTGRRPARNRAIMRGTSRCGGDEPT
jgi:hypothetical protein